MDVLATITICTNDVIPTLFCDEMGYDIIPVQMVNVLNIQEENNSTLEPLKEPTLEVEVNHVRIENKVSLLTHLLGMKHKGKTTMMPHMSWRI